MAQRLAHMDSESDRCNAVIRSGQIALKSGKNDGMTLCPAMRDHGVHQPAIVRGDVALERTRWILDFDAVSTVIAGASKPEQVRSNAEAANLPPLPESLHADLARFYGERVRDTIKVPI